MKGLTASAARSDGRAAKSSGEGSNSDPYRIEGPALISFSGGRTSAYMLHEILRAYDGKLPDNVVVAFANTGKEREETLRFVHECETRWNVRVHWLEWRPMPERFAEVGYNSADRTGAPFEGLIALRGRLPNPLQRFCSRELKVEPIKAFCRSLGWDRWTNVIGLRADEAVRIFKKLSENEKGGHRWKSAMPLAGRGLADPNGVTKRDVMAFWLGLNADPLNLIHPLPQGFDLCLRNHEGNCDLCFLKSRGKLQAIIRANPGAEDWWIAQEVGGKRFERDRSYAEIAAATRAQPLLPLDDDEHDAECGLWCAPDEQEAA